MLLCLKSSTASHPNPNQSQSLHNHFKALHNLVPSLSLSNLNPILFNPPVPSCSPNTPALLSPKFLQEFLPQISLWFYYFFSIFAHKLPSKWRFVWLHYLKFQFPPKHCLSPSLTSSLVIITIYPNVDIIHVSCESTFVIVCAVRIEPKALGFEP